MKVKKYKLKYSNEDINFINGEISKCLKTGYLTDGGPNVDEFEKLWSEFNGSKYSIAVSNCTTGLESILRAIKVDGFSVIVPAYTFIASIMSIYNARGIPILADINRDTLSISLESIKKSIRKDTKAVMVVHVGGVVSNEILEIRKYCDENNLFLIEDAACAHGSCYKGVKSGSKVLTSGEGGIVTTEDEQLFQKIKRIRAIGLDRSINNWESFNIGSNAKMSEVTAILAILHTKQARRIISERQKIAKYYDTNINFNNNFKKFTIPTNSNSSYYKYYIKLDEKQHQLNFKNFAASKGIELPPLTYSYTCDQQEVCKQMGCVVKDDLKNSKYMTQHHICLPMYNGLTDSEVQHVVKSVNEYLEKLS
jgi:perosamine synthetase